MHRKNSDYGKVGPEAGRQQLLAQIFRESPEALGVGALFQHFLES